MSDRKPSQTFDLLTREAEPDTTSATSQGQVHAEAAIHPLHQLQRLAGNRFTQQRLSRQADSNGDIQPGSAIQSALDSVGGGQPLPTMTRVGMGMALGADLSGVRIHRGPVAAAAASELGARAFTVGRDIFFGEGQYDPTSPTGRDLLAHELAHTLQAGAGGGLDLTQLDAQPPDPQITESEPVERVQAEPVSLDAPPEEVVVEPSEPAPEEERPAEGEGRPAPAAAAERRAQVQVQIEEVPPAPENTRPDVELLMPTPPEGLTANSRGRLTASQQTMGSAATEVETLPTSEESTQAARDAVEEPGAETLGRAEGRLAEALGVRPEPSPEIVELCENIRQSIREKRPVDEDELVEADPEEMAQQAGTELNTSVEGDTGRIQGSYDEMNEPQEGTPELTPQPIDVPPTEVATPDPNAAAAAPDAIDPAITDLNADQEQMDAEMEAAGMNSETAQAVQDPNNPVVQARAARGELEETAQSKPGEVIAAQDAALQEASANMGSLQEQALAAFAESRSDTVSDVSGQQTEMVGTEDQIREQLSNRASQIFTDAQTRVNALLQPLTDNAMEKWRAGVARLSTDFRQSLNRVKAWIDERHSGFGGAIVAGWDALTGLPGWVTREYDRAEKQFGDDVCDLIIEISAEVNLVIAACEAIIDDARQDIDALYTQEMPEGLREWAEAERQRMQGQLDGLQNQVTSTQQDFNRGLSREAVRAVREVQDEVAKLREEAKGLIGRIADAIGDFLDDPIRAIINGLLSLVGIQPSAFWALVNKVQQVISDIADDPKRFVNNLVSAVGQGFQQFFDNILKHLLAGFIDWLFGGLPSVGVEIPTEFSLKSVITFFLQLMGITWPRIRQILVRHVGEKNVALIEKAWSVISTLIEKGPQGIFEWIKQMLDPSSILRQIIDAAINFVVEALIKNVTVRVIALFNPVGAIAQAIELIYKVLKWIFTNAARIFSFVETVVNGMADIIAGNIGGMAKAVEAALAKLIPPVIDFLAGLIGLGDLPNKVVETVKSMQEWVMSILDRAIGWLVEQGHKLLAAVGLGREEEPGAAGELGPVGDTINFTGGDASHRMWIQESGTTTTVMVASGEESVGQKLARWKSEAPRLGEQQGQAEGLISQAVSQLGTTDKEAYEAAVAKQQAEAQASAGAAGAGQAAAPANTAAQKFEQENQEAKEKQQGLSEIMAQLMDLFEGGRVEFAPIEANASMHQGAAVPIRIEAAGDNLAISIDRASGTQKILSIVTGPLAGGANASGLRLTRDVLTQITPIVSRVGDAALTDNLIKVTMLEQLTQDANEIAKQVGRLGIAMKVQDLERPTRIDSMDQVTIEFTYKRATNTLYKGKFAEELLAQLQRQESGLNKLTVDRWSVNVNIYRMDASDLIRLDTSAREVVLEALRKRASSAAATARTKKSQYEAATTEIDAALAEGRIPERSKVAIAAGRFGDETTWRSIHATGIQTLRQRLVAEDNRWSLIASTSSRLAVLHNPDQVAGGPGEIPEVPLPPDGYSMDEWEQYLDQLSQFIGAKRVNSAIGFQWGRNIDAVYTDVTSRHPQEAWPIWRLNLKLETQET